MSAGEFIRSKYAATTVVPGGTSSIHPIRVQPETEACVLGATPNTPPAGAVTSNISAKASGGRSEIGLKAARVNLTWTGAPPAGYLAGGIVSIPALTPEFRAAAVVGATGTYLATGCQVISLTPESTK